MNLINQNKKNLKNSLNIAFFLALKNILYKKKMFFLIVFIIGLGFLSTLFTSGIIDGLQYSLEDKAITTIYGNIILDPPKGNDYIESADYIINYLERIEGVDAASKHIVKGIVLIDSSGQKISGGLYIIDPEMEKDVTIIDDSIIRGKYLSPGARKEILIGSDLTEKYRSQEGKYVLDVSLGDKVTAIMENNQEELTIGGIYQSGFTLTDEFVFMNEEDAKVIFNLSDEELNKVNSISIKTKRGVEDEVVARIKASGLNVDANIGTWEEKLGIIKQLGDSFAIVANMTSAVGIFISFAIIYILILINVMQKRSQIGILKSIGIEGRTILVSYILQSFVYCFFGVIFGIILTHLLIMYFLTNPMSTPIGYIVLRLDIIDYVRSSVLLMLSSVFAGYFASRGIVKENILEAIFNG